MAVKTKIGKEFLSLVDMFKGTPQGKYINRHTIKLSYSTMKNLKSHISSTNLKKLNSNQKKESVQVCKCEKDKEIKQCPVNKQCTKDNVVYQAEVKSKFGTKYYIGMSGRPFIDRYKEHRGNVRHPHQKGTKLSQYIHKQNNDYGDNIEFKDLNWSLKSKTTPYRAGARWCDTCLTEKTYITLAKPSESLNLRKEIVSKCPHRRGFKLKHFKPP